MSVLGDTIDMPPLQGAPWLDEPNHEADTGAANLEALQKYQILDSAEEPTLDGLTQLAALVTGRPMAFIAFMGFEQQHYRCPVGLTEEECKLAGSISASAIASAEIFEIPNAREDSRFRESQLVATPMGIRAIAGAPLITPEGFRIGAIIVLDKIPGALLESQRAGLRLIADQVIHALNSRVVARELQGMANFKRALLNCAAEALISATPDGIITTFNPEAEHLTGWSAAEMIGLRTPGDFHDPDEVEARAATLSQELGEQIYPGFEVFVAKARRGTPETREWTYIRKDGARLPVLLTVSAVHNREGTLTGFLGVVRDISQIRKLLEDLRESNDMLAEAQRIAQLGSCHVDMGTGECRCSDECYQILGLPQERPIAPQDLVERLHPEDRDAFANEINRWMVGGEPLDCEYRILVEGQLKWLRFRAHARPPRSEQGATIFSTIQDVTLRRTSEQLLRDSQDLLHRTGRIAHVGGWELDLADRKLQWTLQTYSIYEVPRAHVPVPDDLFNHFPAHARACLAKAVESAAESGNTWDLELPFITAKGRHIWVRLTGEAELKDGTPIKLFGLIKDITERKLATLRAEAINCAQMAFLGSGELDQSMLPLAEAAALITQGEIAFIARFEPLANGQIALKCLAAIGADWTRIKPGFCVANPFFSHEVLDQSTPLGRLLRCEAPTFVNLPGGTPSGIDAANGGIPLRSIAAVPIESGGHTIGVLCVANCAQLFAEADTTALLPLVSTAAQLFQAHRVNQQLDQERERLTDILEGTNVGTWEWNIENGTAILNERWAEIAGYSLEELQPIDAEVGTRFMHPDDRQRARDILNNVFARKLDYFDLESRTLHKDGHWIWTHDRGKVIEWTGAGLPLRMSGTRTDITARKTLDDEHQQHAAHTAAILDSVYDGIITIDANGTSASYSPAAERILGYAAEEVLGRNVSMLMPMPHRARHDSYIQRYQASHVPRIIGIGRELEARRKDGKLVPIDLAITEYRHAGQERYVGTIRDTSDRKWLERALKFVSEELYRLTPETIYQETALFMAQLFDAGVVFICKRLDGPQLQHETLAFYENGVLQKNVVYDIDNTPCADVNLQANCSIASGAQARYPEDSYLQEHAIECYVGVPLQDSVGKLAGIMGFMDQKPRTDLRRIESILGILSVSLSARLEQIRGSLRLFDMFEFSPDAILVLDGPTTIKHANRMAATLFARDITELRHAALQSLFCLEERKEPAFIVDDNGKLQLSPLVSREGVCVNACLPQGAGLPVEIALGNTNSLGEELFIITARDISQRRSLETRARRTQRLEAIGTLTGGIAHDLNNALAPILMATNFLRVKYPTELEFVDMLQTCVERASGIVRQLVAFAKGTQSERSNLDLSVLVREMEKIVQGTFPRGIRVHSRVPEGLPTVLGDATQLHQVLFNLCCNARDAMPDGGALLLEVDEIEIDDAFACSIPGATAGRYVRLTVQDNGAGITQESQEHMFEPFYTTKPVDKGTGLGLSTALAIVRSHRGFIVCHSAAGEGSTFRVYLPAVPRKGYADVGVPAAEEALARGNSEYILFVEDDAVLAEVAHKVLINLNYRAEVARDGVDALLRYSANRDVIQAVITDIHMPNMDGVQLVRAIRSISRDVPILVVSGRIQEALTQELRALRVTHFLDKPFTEGQLAQVLREVLARPPQSAP